MDTPAQEWIAFAALAGGGDAVFARARAAHPLLCCGGEILRYMAEPAAKRACRGQIASPEFVQASLADPADHDPDDSGSAGGIPVSQHELRARVSECLGEGENRLHPAKISLNYDSSAHEKGVCGHFR